MSFLLDEHALKTYGDNVVVVPVDANPLNKYRSKMMKAKRMILDEVKNHVVYHITRKGTTKEMWDALSTLYQGYSEQWNMYLEEMMRCTRMQKGECIDCFLTRIQDV